MSSTLDTPAGARPDELTTAAVFRRWAWRVLFAAMFCYLFFYTGRQAFGFAIPGIQAEFGWTKATVGTISGIALWSYAAGQMVNGNLVDKFGGRRLMALGAVLSTSFCIVASFQTSVVGMAIALGANGFVQAMGWSAGGRVISNWWSHQERGKSFGWYTLAAGLASVLVFVTSTLIIKTFDLDWQWLFRAPVLLMLIGGIVFFLVARESPRAAGVTPPAAFTSDPDNAEHDVTSAAVSSLTRYRAVMSIPKIWVTGVAIGFQNAARYGLLVWVPVYFAGLNTLWVSVALPVGMAVGALTQGQLSDRLFGSRRDRPIMLFMVCGAASALVMYLVQPGIGLGIVLMFVTGFFVYGPQSSFWALCPDLAGSRMAGTATGFVNFFAYLFAGAAEPLIGHLMDDTGNTSLIFPIVAVACAVSAAVASFIRPMSTIMEGMPVTPTSPSKHASRARAAIWSGTDTGFTVEDVVLPDLRPGELLVRTELATVCGSDLHTINGDRPTPLPTVLGHEAIGVVVATGGDVTGPDDVVVAVGDRVTWTIGTSCGTCRRCRRGIPQKCVTVRKYGHEAIDDHWRLNGGFGDHVHLVAGTGIVRLSAELPASVATPANCATATVTCAARRIGLTEEDAVVVIGCGMLGLTAVAYAVDRGCVSVVACDVDPARRALALEFGATVAVAPEGLAAAVADHGADAILELSGNSRAVQSALEVVDLGGRIALVGSVSPAPEISFEPSAYVKNLTTVVGSHNYRVDDLVEAVAFLERTPAQQLFADLVPAPFSLAEIDDAIASARTGVAPRVAVHFPPA